MKKLSIIVILSIIFNLCIIPYGYVHADPDLDSDSQSNTQQNEQQETQKETQQETQTENQQETQTETQQSDKTETQTEDKEETKQNDQLNLNPEYSGENDLSKQTIKNESSNKSNSRQKAETRKSDNANLSDLGITPNDFKGFKPSTLAYSVTVSNDVESINVYAKVQDSKAQITSGTGSHNLNVGINDIQVIVTAENGDTKTYTISITREEAIVEQTDAKTDNVNKDFELKKLEIKGYSLSPSFSPDVFEYKLDVKNDVTKLDVVTEGMNDKVSIDVAGNNDIKERRKYYNSFGK